VGHLRVTRYSFCVFRCGCVQSHAGSETNLITASMCRGHLEKCVGSASIRCETDEAMRILSPWMVWFRSGVSI
jgi:hypothetical protein